MVVRNRRGLGGVKPRTYCNCRRARRPESRSVLPPVSAHTARHRGGVVRPAGQAADPSIGDPVDRAGTFARRGSTAGSDRIRSKADVYSDCSGVWATPARIGLRSTYTLHARTAASSSNA